VSAACLGEIVFQQRLQPLAGPENSRCAPDQLIETQALSPTILFMSKETL
jgi:hypothetical protein